MCMIMAIEINISNVIQNEVNFEHPFLNTNSIRHQFRCDKIEKVINWKLLYRVNICS
jgi:hypothetical protein